MNDERVKEAKLSRNKFVRGVLIVAGSLCVVIGIIGIFVPLLPTADFLFLAALCYGASSERLYHWLMYNRVFGKYLRNYIKGNGMTLGSKIFTLTVLWLTIGYTALFVLDILYVKIGLIVIALGVTVHLLMIKTAKVLE